MRRSAWRRAGACGGVKWIAQKHTRGNELAGALHDRASSTRRGAQLGVLQIAIDG
jgi:hypothetical protein